MFEQIGENDILVIKDDANRKSNSEIPSNGNQMTTFYQTYEKRMIEYMESVPHIPPTLFELRLRHNDIKSDVIKQFKNSKMSSKQLVSRLENNIEKIYSNLAIKNTKEYKTCQAGFIIGWKCNVNKPNNKFDKIDDRF